LKRDERKKRGGEGGNDNKVTRQPALLFSSISGQQGEKEREGEIKKKEKKDFRPRRGRKHLKGEERKKDFLRMKEEV